MKKVLFCNDLSVSCQSLCSYISDWVSGTDIIIDIVHSYDPDLVNISEADLPQFLKYDTKRKAAMTAEMQAFLNKLPVTNRGQVHLEEHVNRALSIQQVALRINADLIITGLRDRYTLMDKLIGSTAAKLVGKRNPYLLVIPYDRKYEPIQKVLFTTQSESKDQLSDREEDALIWLFDHLDRDAIPAIHILHITKDKTPSSTVEQHHFMKMKFMATYSPDVVMGIIDHIETSPVDLLVVHHEEKNLWERIHKSSVAKNLLYKSKMPILFT